jgi:hypothetical protein
MLCAVGSILLVSCGFLGLYNDGARFAKGYENEYGQYVPKKPNFTLKDKKGHVTPANLDTVHVYRYEMGDEYEPRHRSIHFVRFFSAGRCLTTSIPAKDEFGFDNCLKEEHLSPQNWRVRKGYYYSRDGKKGGWQTFHGIYNAGGNGYSYNSFFLNAAGDTLTSLPGNSAQGSVRIFVRETIPEEWEKFPVDW